VAKHIIGEFVTLDRVFLDHENPRHEPYATQEEVITYLCKDEEVMALARDIARHGLNPLELLAVLPGKAKDTWIAAEGNRRVCALKLLNDPELAPPDQRAFFERHSGNWTPITEVPVVKFGSKDAVQLWLDRIHQGPNNGVGRKSWNADQKARNSGNRRFQATLAVLDYAQDNGLISAEQRKKRLTTAQRFLSNPLMREALGVDLSDPDNVSLNRPDADFKKLLQTFIADLLSDAGEVTSRKLKKDIESYARKLSRLKGLSGEIVEPEPIVTGSTKTRKGTKTKPSKPVAPSKLHYDDAIAQKLKDLGSYKLENLYWSICDINLNTHTPLITVGFWSFMETLTTRMGSTTDFSAYFSKQYLQNAGFGDGQKTKALRDAILRLSANGNTTKHDQTAAQFNGAQLSNDMETMAKLILHSAEAAIAKK
jgi:hypothetical protein